MFWAEPRLGLPRSGTAWLRRECARAWRPFWDDSTWPAPCRDGQTTMLLRTGYFRQAACVAFVFLLVTLGSIVWGQHLLEQVMVSHVENMLSTELRTYQLLDRPDDTPHLAQAFARREAAAPHRERSSAVQSADGTLLYGNPDLLSTALCAPTITPCAGWLRARMVDAEGNMHEWMGNTYTLPDRGRYVVAYDILPMLDRVSPLSLATGASVFMILLVSLGVGLRFSLNAVLRIDHIRQTMARFAGGKLDARVTLRASQDEFDQLGHDVNLALTRIHQLMEEVRNATNHIAHELRTPLTRLQQRLSNVADTARNNPVACAELVQAEEETQRILQMFRTVMRISEIETGRCQHASTNIDADTLLADVRDYYEVLAEQRGIALHIRTDSALQLSGDRALLFQALINLLDNAIKYAPDSSTVTLLARQKAQYIELGVADHGPGIDAALRDLAIQRFQRLSRDRSTTGHGLGLALVQAIAKLHGGDLVLADHDLRSEPARVAGVHGLLALLQLPLTSVPKTQ